MSKILITGATGFLGKKLCKNLIVKDYFIHAALRSENQKLIKGVKGLVVGDINSETRWDNALLNTDCVIHCAARTHKLDNKKLNMSSHFNKINVEGTKNLAIQAASKGVKRFIFISSIKVNGEQTIGSSSFNINDIPKPDDDYGKSKWEAEQQLREVSKMTGLDVVIIRPPLIYGEGVKGNFLRLLDLIYRGVPLPLAGIKNNRSFIGLDNLADAIAICIKHPKAVGKTFLISDKEHISTSDLIIKLAKLMKKPIHLFSVPITLIKFIGQITGKSSEIKRILNSLIIDSSDAQKILGWSPKLSLDEGLKKTVNWYLDNK